MPELRRPWQQGRGQQHSKQHENQKFAATTMKRRSQIGSPIDGQRFFRRFAVRFVLAPLIAATFFFAILLLLFAAPLFFGVGSIGLETLSAAAFSSTGAASPSFLPPLVSAPARVPTTTPVAAAAAAPSAAPATDFTASAASPIMLFFAMHIP